MTVRPFIEKFSVQNFGCLQDVSLEFAPFTVLVGPNDSGKSMLLRALVAFTQAHHEEKGWQALFATGAAFQETLFEKRLNQLSFSMSGFLDPDGYEYNAKISLAPSNLPEVTADSFHWGNQCQITRDAKQVGFSWKKSSVGSWPCDNAGVSHLPSIHKSFLSRVEARTGSTAPEYTIGFQKASAPFLSATTRVPKYTLQASQIRELALAREYINQPLSFDGRGLACVIADLLLRNRPVFNRIEKALSEAMPQVKSLNAEQVVANTGNGHEEIGYKLQIETSSGALVPSHLISDGVLLFLGYLTIVLGVYPVSVLLVEEPEIGIHPGLLKRVVGLLKDLSQGKFGPPVQVIVTTHSPLLLNYIEPSEIRVFQRGADGASTISRFDQVPELESLLEYQGPGEIWVNEGEARIVGGS